MADYTESMEGQQCTMTLGYDPSWIRTDNSTLEFTAIGDDSPLIISYYLDKYIDFSSVFRYLSYSVVIIFVLSFTHKMIGAEIMTIYQTLYLSNFFYPA